MQQKANLSGPQTLVPGLYSVVLWIGSIYVNDYFPELVDQN